MRHSRVQAANRIWQTCYGSNASNFTSIRNDSSGTSVYENDNPKIVCLCGSTRFYKEFQEAYYRETMKGNIVLSVGFYPHASIEAHGEVIGITPKEKEMLDKLHKKKILMSDEVLVINVGGYIGESTKGEIEYARSLSKNIKYLEGE